MRSGNSPLADVDISSAKTLRLRQADAFGAFAGALAKPWNPPLIADPELALEWSRLVAEEILLAQLCGLEIHRSWLREFLEVCPFAGGRETLPEVWERVAWVAVVPLIRPGLRSGALIRVWGLHTMDDAAWVEAPAGSSPLKSYAIRLGGWDHPIAGNSWHLGASLASRAATEKRADLQLALARDWIITGEVSGESVEKVDVKNKATIQSDRRWLVPIACQGEFAKRVGRIRTCSDLRAAWIQLSGEGTLGHGMIAWPTPGEVLEMHATVSKAIRPVIASVLLTCPARVMFWHSANIEESGQFAELLESFFKDERVRGWPGWRERPPVVRKSLLPDGDLVAGENALREAGLHQASEGAILFNITCGNLIMKLAAHHIARINPSVWLIYREPGIDDAKEVILIRNLGHSPSTGRMSPRDPPAGVSWDFVNNRDSGASVDSLIDEVFGNCD